jgi:hypothetical protein
LSRDGFDDRRVFVAKIDAHQLGREIKVSLSISIDEIAALGVGDVKRNPAFLEFPSSVIQLASPVANFSGREVRRHHHRPYLNHAALSIFGHGRAIAVVE